MWVRPDGRRQIGVHPLLDCNWLQAMENSADVLHASILHQDTAGGRGRPVASTTRGRVDDVANWDVYMVSYGIMKRRVSTEGSMDEQPLIFPNILCSSNDTQIRVPIDDTHTQIWYVYFIPGEPGDDEEPEVSHVAPFKEPVGGTHPFTRYRMDLTSAQDFMAWETQGPIADRTIEHLATSDRGIVMLRQLYFDNIERVRQGLDPFGVIRDPDHAMIDTNLDAQLALEARPR